MQLETADTLVSSAIAQRLLESVIAICHEPTDLAERRRRMLDVIGSLVEADSGLWGWGLGRPGENDVTPIAKLDFGVAPEQVSAIVELVTNPEIDLTFRQRVFAKMGDSRQATNIRETLYSAEEWSATHAVRQCLARGGWGTWLHSVRYSNHDTWSSLVLLRREGQPEFTLREVGIVNLVMSGVNWLHSTTDESRFAGTLQALTPRQRMVMLMLLDGLPRKAISHQLGITEDTVGEHIQLVYAHFGVSSSGELAARFLRSK